MLPDPKKKWAVAALADRAAAAAVDLTVRAVAIAVMIGVVAADNAAIKIFRI